MGYSTTCDASHKVKAAGSHRTHFVRHIARDADITAGYDFGHANSTIDKARTHLNRSMVNDGAGGFRPPVATLTEDGWRPPSAELNDYIQARLDTVTKTLRKDAVAVRPLVMKLDGAWWDEHCPEWETEGMNAEAERLHAVMVGWACDRFGQQNAAGYAYHLDEAGYPEIQFLMTPVTDDGRLSQKDFFPDGANMSKMHQDLRKHLREHGYDAEMSVTRRSKERLNSNEYARRADKATAMEKRTAKEWDRVREADKTVLAAGRDVTARELALTGREAAVEAQKADLEAREAVLVTKAADLDEREQEHERRVSAYDPDKVDSLLQDAFKDELKTMTLNRNGEKVSVLSELHRRVRERTKQEREAAARKERIREGTRRINAINREQAQRRAQGQDRGGMSM